MIMEFGFIGLLAVFYFCREFLERCQARGKGVPLGFFAGAVMSNAFLNRPYIAIWVLTAGLFLCDQLNEMNAPHVGEN